MNLNLAYFVHNQEKVENEGEMLKISQ